MAYVPMGFWPRLIARLLSFSTDILRRGKHEKDTQSKPVMIKTWRQGVFMQWKSGNEPTFVLIQSDNQMYTETLGSKPAHYRYIFNN